MSHPEEHPHKSGFGKDITILTMVETSTSMAHAFIVNKTGDYQHPFQLVKLWIAFHQRNQGYGWGMRLGVLPGVPSCRLLESNFLWSFGRKSTVFRPPGIDLERFQQYSRSPTLTVLLVLPISRVCISLHSDRDIWESTSPDSRHHGSQTHPRVAGNIFRCRTITSVSNVHRFDVAFTSNVAWPQVELADDIEEDASSVSRRSCRTTAARNKIWNNTKTTTRFGTPSTPTSASTSATSYVSTSTIAA